ncbi:Putative UDP-glucuronosyltransferase ugt-50 [Toxocara canis]|uniref:UDP-glucuronosyltransferase n=1 Tax=Toxocara canis TaxID=6265 RepID=A0A0B2W5L4_TOXCA|nr:Putative UDP-glucuronosyltransferase ugt-50 [Toxocara canis]
MSSALILSVIVILSSCCEGHKILVYSPKLFYSHFRFMGHIADILAAARHDVVVLMPECDERIKTNGTTLARPMRANCSFDGLSELLSTLDDIWIINTGRMDFLFSMAWALSSKENLICRGLLGDMELISRLRNEKFDLGISEAFSFCGFGVFDKIGLQKHLSAFNTQLIESMTEPYGINYNPSHVPALLSQSDDAMSFVERMQNFIVFGTTYVLTRFIAVPHALLSFEEYIRRPFTIAESIEILARCSSVFVNTNILLESPRELNSKIAFIGGITATQSSSLSEDFKHLMDVSSGGVVLVSFGTAALSSRMPTNLKYVFVSVFRRFPEITFIWKYELDDEVGSDLPNVIKRKWVPQAGLLFHKNMRAFVSQCGSNALSESVYAGVPIVCIPIFIDQMRNARKLEKQHSALVIHNRNFTAQSLEVALRGVLYDKSYSISARRVSAMVRDAIIPLEEQISGRARIAIKMKKVELLDAGYRKLNCLKFFYIDVICIPLILIILLS